MRTRQTLLAVVAGAGLLGVAMQARADEDRPPPIVVQPEPDQKVIVDPVDPAPTATIPEPTTVPAPVVPAPVPPPTPVYAEPVAPPPVAPPPPKVKKERKRNPWFDPRDISLTAGAGVTDFVSSDMRSATEIGGGWDARLTIGTRSLVAFEAGYSGTYNKLQGLTDGPGSVAPYMVNNGVDSAFRLNLLPYRFQPYVFTGIGYNRANLHNLDHSPAMATRFNRSDDQFLVPAGAGFALHLFKHANFDSRFTYRAIMKEDLDRLNDARMDQWQVSGRFGYTF
jgi:hypothetical protein